MYILIHMGTALRVGNQMTSILLTVYTFVNVFMGMTHMGFTLLAQSTPLPVRGTHSL